MKGQHSVLEYLFMTLFMIIMIVAIILFLSWWQFMQLETEGIKIVEQKKLSLIRNLMAEEFMNKDNSMLDDSKLTVMASDQREMCESLQKLYGKNWYFKVSILDDEDEIDCTEHNYPDCNHWELCVVKQRNQSSVYFMPVNIHRKMGIITETGTVGRVDIGLLEVGVYNE